MRISGIHNLSTALLHAKLFGSMKFARTVRHVSLPAVCPPAAVRSRHHVHVLDQLRVAPLVDPCPRRTECIDVFEPQPWPYDTPMPVGLPRLPEHPGAASSATVRPDNAAQPVGGTSSSRLSPADADGWQIVGSILDVSV